jgi:DNA-binding response OmpR family regulator
MKSANSVRADDLIRKPFQPQDLITRVKNLLHPKTSTSQATSDAAQNSDQHVSRVLNNLFSATPTPFGVATPMAPRAETPVFASASRLSVPPASVPAAPPRSAAAPPAEIQKLRNEIRRLELLVKKLEAELQAEHQYCAALEAHFKLQQESE